MSDRSVDSTHRGTSQPKHGSSLLKRNNTIGSGVSKVHMRKLLNSQRTFMLKMRAKLKVVYEEHDEFKDFLGDDEQARQALM